MAKQRKTIAWTDRAAADLWLVRETYERIGKGASDSAIIRGAVAVLAKEIRDADAKARKR